MDLALLLILAIIFFCTVWLFIGLVIYFTPVIIAYIRKHNNILAITIMTIFIGWTFLGWLGALLWALNSDVQEQAD